MDPEARPQQEPGRVVGVVLRVGRLPELELVHVAAVGVAEERPPGAEPGAERGSDGRRVDADRDESRVGDLDLVLERHEAVQELLLLRTPPPAVEVHEGRIAADEGSETPRVVGVVDELEVGEGPAGPEVVSHRIIIVGQGIRRPIQR